VNGEELGHEVLNEYSVCAEKSAEPMNVVWFVLVDLKVVNEDLIIMFGFDGLEVFDGVDLDE
jgi:hypothetical protein